jgi:ribosomal-protein-alanine N-acetyltransferase
LICSAGINQIEDILSIERISFTRPWTRNQITKDLQNGFNSENWVYKLNGNVIGYIFVSKIEDQFHLNNIAVHPDFLGQKIGSSLIKHIIMRAKNRKVNIILLEVSINNITARKCYKSLGFIQVGIRKNYYSKGDDAILYDLEIA